MMFSLFNCFWFFWVFVKQRDHKMDACKANIKENAKKTMQGSMQEKQMEIKIDDETAKFPSIMNRKS